MRNVHLRPRCFALALLLLACPLAALAREPASLDPSDVKAFTDDFFRTNMETMHVPGAVFVVIAGGFVPQVSADTGRFYGIVGLAGLIGLFSRQAMNKLRDIFDVIFARGKLDDAEGAAVAPPQLDGVHPDPIPVANQDTEVTVTGRKFVPGAVVKIGNVDLKTTFKNNQELIALIPASYLAKPDKLELAVDNPGLQGGASEAKEFPVQ